MQVEKSKRITQESIKLESAHLDRTVQVDLYFTGGAIAPDNRASLLPDTSLLLINDGQDMEKLGLADLLDDLCGQGLLSPLLCAGIHAGPERIMEYGTVPTPDCQGRGARAADYTRCILEEVLPAIRQKYKVAGFREKAFAGFSLGALSAMDIVWHHPQEFTRAGLFSGSFWWRTRDKTDPQYNELTDRIMQCQVRNGEYYPWLKFFFECGTEDEQEDRNGNGIIDSIDDTQDLIKELMAKGYVPERDIRYLEIEGGRHDVATWALAMPEFLKWGWGK
ncbi:MAG TPA: alpha/beta hydrolase-fold protein [Puia sp.]|nr:alpha/beta hydrolase-fold protein [Puia sp.]